MLRQFWLHRELQTNNQWQDCKNYIFSKILVRILGLRGSMGWRVL